MLLTLSLAACASPAPSVPIVIVNDDDESARIEVTLYRIQQGDEITVVEPFALAPGESTRISLEPTFDGDRAFQLMVNEVMALNSQFVCDLDKIPERLVDLPRSVKIVVLDDGTTQACPFEEADL